MDAAFGFLSDELQGKAAVFALVLTRLSGLFLSAPFFSGVSTPPRLKVLFAAGIAVCVAPLLGSQQETAVAAMSHPLAAILTVGAELTLGFAVGLIASIVVGAIQTSGYLISLDMGMTIANVLDPVSNLQTSVLGQLKSSFAVLLFLLLDLHHWLIGIVVSSFETLPIGTVTGRFFSSSIREPLTEVASAQGQKLLDHAVQLALPVSVTLILVTVAMGFLARTVPEMNVFILGFAIRIIVGIWVVILIFPLLAMAYERLLWGAIEDGQAFLRLLSTPSRGI